jgi:hypothetical protein
VRWRRINIDGQGWWTGSEWCGEAVGTSPRPQVVDGRAGLAGAWRSVRGKRILRQQDRTRGRRIYRWMESREEEAESRAKEEAAGDRGPFEFDSL